MATPDTDTPLPSDPDYAMPQWARDWIADHIDAVLPVSFMAFGHAPRQTFKLYLGKDAPGEARAVVLLDTHPRNLDTEELCQLAGGAWQTCTQQVCDRETAELIAKGWIACIGSTLN